MLDFYFIADREDDWEEPDESRLAGSFSLDEFRAMRQLLDELDRRGIGTPFSADVRIRSGVVEQMIKITSMAPELDTQRGTPLGVAKLHELLVRATSTGVGLITFAD